MNIQDRVLRIWGIKECGDGELCSNCNRAREEFERFADEIKKRCKEKIPKSWLDPMLTGEKAVIGRPPYGCPEVEAILNAIRQAIDQMEIE